MKTIFISLPSPNVFRNLFFFEGSVADRLMNLANQRDDLRLVFIIIEKDTERYGKIFEGRLSNNMIVEKVDINFKRSFFQKLAKFFYSYLIYTNTTKVLATMGMRPDEPPAGGNRYFAPLKWFIANTFGKSDFVRNKIAPSFYYLAHRDRPFKKFFDKYKPDLVFITSIYDKFDSRLLPEARLNKVKTIGMAASWDHVDKFYLPFKTDVFLAPSNQVKNAAINFQRYNERAVKIVGYPYLDFLVSPLSRLSDNDVLMLLDLPLTARYILYISGSAYCPDEPDVIEEILRFVEAGEFGDNTYLVVRPYLGSRGKDKDFDTQKFNAFKNRERVRVYDSKGWGYLDDSRKYMSVLRMASAIIAVYSTTFLEAVVYDRPLVAATFDGWNKRPMHRSIVRFEKFEHFQDVLKIGAIKRTHNFSELKKSLQDYIANPSLDFEKREIMRKEICNDPKGDSSALVVKEILKALNMSL